MKKLTYNALSSVAGIAAAIVARKIVSALWRSDTEPPLNPADRRTSWPEALAWGVATAIGAAVARVAAARSAPLARSARTRTDQTRQLRSGARPRY